VYYISLDCVNENISEVECGDSGDEISHNQKFDHKSGISDSEKSEWGSSIQQVARCSVWFIYYLLILYFMKLCLC
jgi:hypothetical protein